VTETFLSIFTSSLYSHHHVPKSLSPCHRRHNPHTKITTLLTENAGSYKPLAPTRGHPPPCRRGRDGRHRYNSAKRRDAYNDPHALLETETLDPTISAPIILEPSSKHMLPNDYSIPTQSADGRPLFAPSSDTPAALRVETRKVLVPPHRFAPLKANWSKSMTLSENIESGRDRAKLLSPPFAALIAEIRHVEFCQILIL
jgi:hypothetical protein